MTFQELVDKTKDIDLESIGVYLGKPANMVATISCFEENGEWVIQEITERQKVYEERGSEEEIMRNMFAEIRLRNC